MANAYYLQSPKDQLFYRMLLLMLAMLGLAKINWWEHQYSKKLVLMVHLHGYIARALNPTVLMSLTAAVFAYYKTVTIATLGIMFCILPICVVTNIKNITAIFFKSYEKIMKDFFNKIHLHSYYMKDKDEFIKAKLLEVEKYTRCTGFFISGSLVIDWLSWTIVPIINNFQNKELVLNKTMSLQTCVYLWMPFDYSYDFERWYWIHLFSGYICWAACALIMVFDTMNFAFVFNLIGHIKILKHVIKVRFEADDLNDEDHKERLTEIIVYHAFIVETFKNLESAFGINVAANYLHNLFEDSLLLYQMMFANKGEMITFGLMLLVYMGELIIMSFILEEIRRQSDDLPEVLYNIPWEKMSISNQKIFKLILMRVQPILSFQAACGMETGVKPLLSIMKSTFSYFIMLKSSVQRKNG